MLEKLVSLAFALLVIMAGVRLMVYHDWWGLPFLMWVGLIVYFLRRVDSQASIEQAAREAQSPPVVLSLMNQTMDAMTNAAKLSGNLAVAMQKLESAYNDLDRKREAESPPTWVDAIPAEYRELGTTPTLTDRGADR